MKLCCIMDHVPEIKLTIYNDGKTIRGKSNLWDSDIINHHLWHIYHHSIPTRIRSILTNTNVEDISLIPDTRGILEYKFNHIPETYEIIHYHEEDLSNLYLNSLHLWIARMYQPIFIRKIFDGSQDECIVKKLSSSEKWVPYCSVEQHIEIIKDRLK